LQYRTTWWGAALSTDKSNAPSFGRLIQQRPGAVKVDSAEPFALTAFQAFPIVNVWRSPSGTDSALLAAAYKSVARNEEKKDMTARRTLLTAWVAAILLLGGAVVSLQYSAAQGQSNFNEREIKSSGSLNDDPKSGVWTLDFKFKDPRVIKVNVPGRGTRICWYLWFQVVNRTSEPRTFRPEFELVTLDYPGVYTDETLTTVEDAIRKIEDPTGYQQIKNTVTIQLSPIPVSLAPDKGFPKAVTGIAIFDGSTPDPKNRGEKAHEMSESQRFSIFVGGLSNGFVNVDPLVKGKAEAPVIRKKTLQLNFKRVGDRYSLDSRDIIFEPPAEWIYRASKLPQLKLPNEPAGDSKDAKKGSLRQPLNDINNPYLQPVKHRGNVNGT
jgi:hypothetical protein